MEEEEKEVVGFLLYANAHMSYKQFEGYILFVMVHDLENIYSTTSMIHAMIIVHPDISPIVLNMYKRKHRSQIMNT